MHKPLILVASLLRSTGSRALWASVVVAPGALGSAGSVVVIHGLSCPSACGVPLPRSGIRLLSPALAGRFVPEPPGKPYHLLTLPQSHFLQPSEHNSED